MPDSTDLLTEARSLRHDVRRLTVAAVLLLAVLLIPAVLSTVATYQARNAARSNGRVLQYLEGTVTPVLCSSAARAGRPPPPGVVCPPTATP